MFTLTIHLQTDDLALLGPLARHLCYIEVAIDSPTEAFAKPRQPHPVVGAVIDADLEVKARSHARRLDSDADRKRRERNRMSALSPFVIKAVACPTCPAKINQPCRGPHSKSDFGFHGHTHIARREAYVNQQKAQTS